MSDMSGEYRPMPNSPTAPRRWPWIALGFVIGGITVPVALYGLLLWALSQMSF